LKKIPLTRGKVSVVDNDDFKKVSAYSWCAHRTPTGKWYARSTVMRKHIIMHHLILPPRLGKITDHRDGDGLNNRRSNLRRCTHSQNQRNKISTPHTSRFKGVSWDKRKNRWRAQIELGGRRNLWLGYFSNQCDAASAYDRAAVKHFGAFARVNKRNQASPLRIKMPGSWRGGKQKDEGR